MRQSCLRWVKEEGSKGIMMEMKIAVMPIKCQRIEFVFVTIVQNSITMKKKGTWVSKKRGSISMKVIRFIAMLLIVIGALNWGLVGFFQYDVIADIFGGMQMMAARVVYALVGLAGLYGIGFLCR